MEDDNMETLIVNSRHDKARIADSKTCRRICQIQFSVCGEYDFNSHRMNAAISLLPLELYQKWKFLRAEKKWTAEINMVKGDPRTRILIRNLEEMKTRHEINDYSAIDIYEPISPGVNYDFLMELNPNPTPDVDPNLMSTFDHPTSPELVIGGVVRRTRHGEYKSAGGASNHRGLFAGNQASIHGESKCRGGPAPRPELGTKASKYRK
jgi:hypothetical protein